MEKKKQQNFKAAFQQEKKCAPDDKIARRTLKHSKAVPETAACACTLRKVLGSTKWRLVNGPCITPHRRPPRSSRCCAVLSGHTEQSLKLSVLLSINAEVVPQPCQTPGGCQAENTVGNSFKSLVWVRVQTTARTNHDKSCVT